MQFEYETERLILRVLKPEDAGLVLDFYLRDRELFEQFEPERAASFYTPQYQRNVLRAELHMCMKLTTVRFYVFLKSNPYQIIGTICFHNIMKAPYLDTELGYKFSSEFRHRGYATEALQKGIGIMFGELRLHRIHAYVLPDNAPSCHLCERLHFTLEGCCRALLPIRGTWRDHLQYTLINPADGS